jgi:hypothetical protein
LEHRFHEQALAHDAREARLALPAPAFPTIAVFDIQS